jgi:hypothetical protein
VASEKEEEAEGGEAPLEHEARQEESEEDVGDEEMDVGLWDIGSSQIPSYRGGEDPH